MLPGATDSVVVVEKSPKVTDKYFGIGNDLIIRWLYEDNYPLKPTGRSF